MMTLFYLIAYLAALITQGTPAGATDYGRRCISSPIGGAAWVNVIDYGVLNEDRVPYAENGGLLIDFFVRDDRSFIATIDTGDTCRMPHR